MTYEEFQRQLGKAGLNKRKFAELIKMNPNSLTNYAKTGEVPSHLAVISVLLGALAEQQFDYSKLLSSIEIEPKKPRGSGKINFGANKQKPLDLFSNESAQRTEKAHHEH
ncbi:DNA-binding protein [Pseudomonas koreensis]|uniref:XRE family transcriptional regulator n=1 Tax=Pseudomonas koreensis TaxID=198620 RepID=UPI0010C0C187|nr:XRE family transcriptional regulator [Pseudomonas koreensis]TKJ82545.1 DNA-binding protein [Pseudomonas koreensis]